MRKGAADKEWKTDNGILPWRRRNQAHGRARRGPHRIHQRKDGKGKRRPLRHQVAGYEGQRAELRCTQARKDREGQKVKLSSQLFFY